QSPRAGDILKCQTNHSGAGLQGAAPAYPLTGRVKTECPIQPGRSTDQAHPIEHARHAAFVAAAPSNQADRSAVGTDRTAIGLGWRGSRGPLRARSSSRAAQTKMLSGNAKSPAEEDWAAAGTETPAPACRSDSCSCKRAERRGRLRTEVS